MDHAALLAATERELDALVHALADGPIDVDVPTCPDWQLTDLATHVGEFCAFWSHVLCEGTGRAQTPFPDRPEPGGLAAWVDGLATGLIGELRATPAETPVWTWYEADRSAGFVIRRCAHEAAMHRYDAESARGASQPIDPSLAVDGIDEMLGPLLAVRPRSGAARGQTMHIHGTDEAVDAEWLVTLTPDAVEVAHQHAKGDLALRGSVSDLELVLYQRPPLGEVQRFGDESVLDVWYREFTF